MKLYNMIQKYRDSSVTVKATLWYTICNMFQKIAAFLLIPFLTRILTTSEYGFYAVFLSWVDIFEIFATMRIYSNGYVAGLVKHENDKDIYTCSIQVTSLVITVICFMIIFVFSAPISSLIKIEIRYIYYMFFSFFATSSIGIWSSRQRVNNQYKLMVLVTLLYSVLAPIASIIGAYILPDRLKAVIMVRIFAQFFISVPFFVMNIIGSGKSIALKYCKEAFVYNFPLIPYYLSMVVLNSSDRIMIKEIVGETEAGIYSVAYSLSMAIFVIVGALNLSLQPWIFTKLKTKTANGANKVINIATLFIAILNICVLIIAPELIQVVASEKYLDAIWTMPPIICSLVIVFVYQQFLNIHFFYGKNKIVFIASITAAGMNLILNSIFIRKYGYIAAGYTTLASYLMIAFLYYVSMKKICKDKGIEFREYFDISFIRGVIVVFGCIACMVTLFYPYPAIRYILVLLAMIVVFCIYKRWSRMLKS